MKAIQNIEKKIRVEVEKINSCIFYYMNYYGDYRFDEYLSKGSRNINQFCDFVNETLYPVGNNITLLDYALPRLILNKAKTVDEAILYAQKYNYCYIVSPLHYMVADTTGNSSVIEFVNGRMVETKKNDHFQVATNFTLYNNPGHEGFGKDRYENIENDLKKRKGIISENEALELLKINVIPGDEQWSCV